MNKMTTDGPEQVAAYEPPALGDAVQVEQVTLFSGVVNPDAGVVTFGDG